ncbi:MAG TPA: PKD domain-containing protein [Bacteroidia bacterium]|jgi:gliding motility-associated-like protein|nr:PKD domain-containing protein [Bacteroidia bacterium]
MKIKKIKLLLILLLLSLFYPGISQLGWIQKATFPGLPRNYDAGFSIGRYGFIGLGWNGTSFYNDFYQWNQSTNTWSAIPNYPGTGRLSPITFVIEGKAYVATGWAVNHGGVDTWRYDTISNSWIQMASFPGSGRYDANCFVVGHKAYLISGSTGGPPYVGDAWVYDAHTNAWTQLNTPPCGKVDGAATFTIGSHGYYVGGWDGGIMHSTGYKYDTTTDTWTAIPNIPNYDPGVSGDSRTWVYGSKAYVFNGHNSVNHTFTQGWVYDTVTNNWCEFTDMGKMQRTYPAAFVVNNKFYMGTGSDSLGAYHSDYWQYDPQTKFTVNDTTSLCNGDSVHFMGLSTFDSTSSVSWNWSFPGGSPSTSTIQDPAVYYSVSGTYSVTLIVDACGGDDTVSRNVSITTGTLGGIRLTGKTPICAGTTDTLSASGATFYQWSNGATTSSIIITPATTTTYSLHINNGSCQGDTQITIQVNPYPIISISPPDTICAGNTSNIVAAGGTTYLWNTGATTNSITPSPLSTTIYTVQISNGCAIDTTVKITVKTSPVLTLSPTDTICSGNSVTLRVSGADFYSWTPSTNLSCTNCPDPTASPTVSTSYIVTGTDSDGCFISKSVAVLIEAPPEIGDIPNQTICSGNAVTLQANDLSGFGGNYTWQPGGLTSATISISPSTTTTYTLEYDNKCGSIAKNITVFVNPTPNPSFDADITQGCAPLCIQFRDESTISSGNISQWSWIFGNGDTSYHKTPIYCYPDTGTFSVTHTAVSDKGCSATLEIVKMITVFSKPVANFIYSPQPISILAPVVQFTDQSKDAYGITYWTWNFGDFSPSDLQNSFKSPSHTYADTGIYCLQLMIMNNKGCVDTITKCLEVYPIFTLYIPSAFSPNSDGLNDLFITKGAYVKDFDMYIFDRWGMELFHTTDINKGWNGTVRSNVICQEDTYVYSIIATDCSNLKHSYVGQFSLIK